MRTFPRAARRRLAAATATAALALGSLTIPAMPWAHADDLEDRQDKVEKRIDQAHDHVEESSSRFRKATSNLQATQGRLDAAQSRLDEAEASLSAARVRDREMQDKLETAIQRLEEAGAEVEQGKAHLTSQRDDVADVVSDTYTEGDPQLLAFASFLDAQDPADLTRRVEARRVVVGEETRIYDDLRAAEVLLVVQQDKVEAYRDEVSKRREDAAENLQEMKGLKAGAVAARHDVFGLLKQRFRMQRWANAARRADQRVLDHLKSQQDRIEGKLRRRAEAARRAAARARRAGQVSSSARSVPNIGGYLSRPVTGPVTSPYGYRTHPIYGYYSLHDGVDFGEPCGAPMYAAAPGRVIESYYQTAYGNRLVVDHGLVNGRGLASIYNHATRYTVGVGDTVERGEVIGYIGSTGWSTGCHLHFTVLVNGATVAPFDWI